MSLPLLYRFHYNKEVEACTAEFDLFWNKLCGAVAACRKSASQHKARLSEASLRLNLHRAFADVKKRSAETERFSSVLYYFIGAVFSFWMTSCAPPSTMLVAETSVSFAFS